MVALDLSNSYWIWKKDTRFVPNYDVTDFRYDLWSDAGTGPFPLTADIIIAADNNYTLWVNGNQVGTGTNWTQAQEYCLQLDPYFDVFAVEVVNGYEPPGASNPAGLMVAIEVKYDDGSTRTIVSDDTWLANNATSGFETVYYDDSSWPTAYEVGTAGISGWWHTPAVPSFSLANSQWIWTDEISGPGGNAPIGNRAFRKDISLYYLGAPVTGGTIIICADNAYTLYINGQEIGSSNNVQTAQIWSFALDGPDIIVVAVNAENTGGPAGIIVAIEFTIGDDPCSDYLNFVSDSTWVYSLTVPGRFQYSNFSDSGWPNALEQGLWGVGPWGYIPTQIAN